MADRIIDNTALLSNYKEMINTLEYDSMRSAGKAKLNAQVLLNMHTLYKLYSGEKTCTCQPSKKKKEITNG